MRRIINLCAGPGGWEQGARIIGLTEPIYGYDISADACATATAAGFHRELCDVTTLDPAHFQHTTGAIISAPCGTYSRGGKHTGIQDIQIILDAITHLGSVNGHWDDEAPDGIAPGCGCTWKQIAPELDVVQDPRTRLVAYCARFALYLPELEWLALEQVPELLYAWEDIAAEMYSWGWETVDVLTLEAADYGAAARRKRVFLIARRSTALAVDPHPRNPLPPATLARALDWPAGHKINTRGNRRTSGGNEFRADQPSWCLTGKARGWYRAADHRYLTPAEAGALNTFPWDYPWHGSRTSVFQQIADVVAPVVAAAVLGAATAIPWEAPVRGYLEALYPHHRHPPAVRAELTTLSASQLNLLDLIR